MLRADVFRPADDPPLSSAADLRPYGKGLTWQDSCATVRELFTGKPPTGRNHGASLALAAEKKEFGASRRARWFGLNGAS
ncbi:MAG TPA: hypothetical protein VK754_07585 [Propionibacteriaceae bacterium]|nr:hypothetical protein [Propionibacteriaceae bacterium]